MLLSEEELNEITQRAWKLRRRSKRATVIFALLGHILAQEDRIRELEERLESNLKSDLARRGQETGRIVVLRAALRESLSYRCAGHMPHDVLERLRKVLDG